MDFILHFTSGIVAYFSFCWVIPGSGIYALVGAILPDLIDKPLAILISPGMGRLIGHSLIFILMLLLFAVGVKLWFNSWKMIPLPIMVFVHQIMDKMWDLPENWFFPLLGMPSVRLNEFSISAHIAQEINNPYLIPCIVCSLIGFYIIHRRQGKEG